MKFIVGLGNPGKRYERTRHNLGFLVVDELAKRNGLEFSRRDKYDALVAEWNRSGERAWLVKPLTYMNASGKTLQNLQFESSADVVVVHDDLDLPFRRIRIRQQGSPGGHRGMISATGVLGEAGFPRIRLGIGRPPAGVDPKDFVLQKFLPEEVSHLDEVIARAADAVQCLLDEGPVRAMEKFNRAE